MSCPNCKHKLGRDTDYLDPNTFEVSVGWTCSECHWRGLYTLTVEALDDYRYKPKHFQMALQRLYEEKLPKARMDYLLNVLDLIVCELD